MKTRMRLLGRVTAYAGIVWGPMVPQVMAGANGGLPDEPSVVLAMFDDELDDGWDLTFVMEDGELADVLNVAGQSLGINGDNIVGDLWLVPIGVTPQIASGFGEFLAIHDGTPLGWVTLDEIGPNQTHFEFRDLAENVIRSAVITLDTAGAQEIEGPQQVALNWIIIIAVASLAAVLTSLLVTRCTQIQLARNAHCQNQATGCAGCTIASSGTGCCFCCTVTDGAGTTVYDSCVPQPPPNPLPFNPGNNAVRNVPQP